MKTIFVEDIEQHRITFRQTLSTFPQLQLMGEADSVETGYDLIRKVKPDLVFLDVKLEVGTSFDILNRLRQDGRIDFEIIFLTAHTDSEHAIRAIQYAALDFIYKPLDEAKLKAAIDRAEHKLAEKKTISQYQEQIHALFVILKQLSEKQDSNMMVFHRSGGDLGFVKVQDIVYCKADKDVTRVVMKDNKLNFTAMRNLSVYAKLLEADYNFFRISDKELVNLSYLDKYSHKEDYKLLLHTGDVLYASRRGGQELKQRETEIYQTAAPKPLSLPDVEPNKIRTLLNFMRNFLRR